MTHYLALAGSILLTSIAQVLLKSGVASKRSWLGSFLSRRTITSYGMLGVVTVLDIYALQAIDLKVLGAWVSVNYLLVTLLSWLILKEAVDQATFVGCSLIVLGILIFNVRG